MPQFGCSRGHIWVTADDSPLQYEGCPQCRHEDNVETARMRKQATILADVLEARFPHVFKKESDHG